MLHIGEHHYGVVDQVPGVMHVATRILHFNFIPLIPLGSVVAVDKRVAGELILVKTRFSFKSVVFAYLRLALLTISIFFAIMTPVIWDVEQEQPIPPPWFQSSALWVGAIALAGFIGWWWTHRVTHANYARAVALAESVGMDREIIDENFKSRGLATNEEFVPVTATVAAGADRWGNEEKDDVYRLE